jgi:hypothetical protein
MNCPSKCEFRWVVSVLILLLGPMFYLLSLGPIVRFYNMVNSPSESVEMAFELYVLPAAFLQEYAPAPVEGLLDMYLELWLY